MIDCVLCANGRRRRRGGGGGRRRRTEIKRAWLIDIDGIHIFTSFVFRSLSHGQVLEQLRRDERQQLMFGSYLVDFQIRLVAQKDESSELGESEWWVNSSSMFF